MNMALRCLSISLNSFCLRLNTHTHILQNNKKHSSHCTRDAILVSKMLKKQKLE